MGQTLAIPEIQDSGRHGLDFFLNSQQVQQLIRAGIDIDHVLNPYSFPRTNDRSITKPKEIVPNPEIINIPTHITPKSIKIFPKIIKDSTNTDILTFCLQFSVSVSVPSILKISFSSTHLFPSTPHLQHPLLQQPISVPLHPCIEEIVSVTLPQAFVELLAFVELCTFLEGQGSNLCHIFNLTPEQISDITPLSSPTLSPTHSPATASPTPSTLNPTLFSQAFDIQGIPTAHYLSLYFLSKSTTSLFTHIILSIQTSIPVQTSSSTFSSTSVASSSLQYLQLQSPKQSILTEWVTITLKPATKTFNPSQLRDIVQNFQISGQHYDPLSLNLPARESLLYSSISSLPVHSYTHHIHTNEDCLELLDLYGFINNEEVCDKRKEILDQAKLELQQSSISSFQQTQSPLTIPILDPINVVTQNSSQQSTNNTANSASSLDTYLFEANVFNNAHLIAKPVAAIPIPDTDDPDNDVQYQWSKYPNMIEVPNDCIICMASTATHVIYPCRHLCLCSLCANDVIIKAQQQNEQGSDGIGLNIGRSQSNSAKCPLCRQQLTCIFNLGTDSTQPNPRNDLEEDDDSDYGDEPLPLV